jgi:hypothetical protein
MGEVPDFGVAADGDIVVYFSCGVYFFHMRDIRVRLGLRVTFRLLVLLGWWIKLRPFVYTGSTVNYTFFHCYSSLSDFTVICKGNFAGQVHT